MTSELSGFANIRQVLDLYRITNEEISAIQAYSPEGVQHVATFLEAFYTWMPEVPEFKALFNRPQLLEHVRAMQMEYWRCLLACNLDEMYFQSRLKVGNTHAMIHLPISSYVAGMNFAIDWWTTKIGETQSNHSIFLMKSLNKLFCLDIALVSASYMQVNHELIAKQSRTLVELSTPTMQLWEGILVLPIIGILDADRAHDMMNAMLNTIQQTNAHVIIVDITGVPTVDSDVADHLIKVTKSTKLMGCECILSGIAPDVAQTLVHLGIDLGVVDTASNLQAALQQALVKTGYQIVYQSKATH